MPEGASAQRRRLIVAAALVAGLAVGACAHQRPPGQVAAALYEDAVRVVGNPDTTGWLIDRLEIAELAPTIMQSTCRVAPEHRRAVLRWIDARIDAAGGPAAEVYADSGGDLDAVEHIIDLERTRAAVAYGHDHAAECPFWIEPDPDFRGVQSDAGRAVILLESRGLVAMNIVGGEVAVGGSGGGRLFAGGGLDQDLSIFGGAELGGAALFEIDPETGKRSVKGRIVGAVPLLFRLHDGSQVWDFEVAASGIYREAQERVDLGARLAIGTGAATPREGGFKPQLVAWIVYEIFPAQGNQPINHFIGVGTRFGVNIDP